MLPAFGLYTHIRANRWRSAALLAGLFVLVYVLAFALALLVRALVLPPEGASPGVEDFMRAAWADLLWAAPWVTLGTVLWISVSYWLHQPIIDAVVGSRAVTRASDPRLYGLLETLCISRGMTPPKLRVAEVPALNAFASGLDPEQHTITVTRGLLDALDDRELEAVLAHELTHIRNDDVTLMVVAVVITGVISFVGELIFRRLRLSSPDEDGERDSGGGGGRRKGSGGGAAGAAGAVVIALAMIALAWALSLVIRFALSRSREFLADAGAVELTKNPDALISALTKIAGRGELEGVPSSVMEMCVDNPRSGFADLFATHPPIEERVEALVRYAGGQRLARPTAEESVPEIPAAGPWSAATSA